MKCKDIALLISYFIDGELSRDQQILLQEHLKSCSHCRKELESMRKISESIKAARPPEICGDVLIENLSTNISRRQQEKKWFPDFESILLLRNVLRWVYSNAFVVGILLLTVGIFAFRMFSYRHNGQAAGGEYTLLAYYPNDEESFEQELFKIYYEN